ncbi:MAG TPA: VanZ family protein [Planctomycetaceae bacterium]|jgi:VanZ family protein|nr:VanZ family protein [Planctomycetaceae bacterium]
MTPPDESELANASKRVIANRLYTLATAVLACYWLAMFTGTHWPNFSLERYPQNTDKLLHFSAYAGLSFLIALRLACKRARAAGELLRLPSLAARDALWIMAVIVGYSVFDEVTQPYFGRTCDFFDALADWIGGSFGLGVFAVIRRLLRRLAVA